MRAVIQARLKNRGQMPMSVYVKPITVESDDILIELARDSLEGILGTGYELVADNLPFDGNQILALDAERRPVIVSCDLRDGGRALLYGLAAMEGLAGHRAMLYRLYPTLFRSGTERGSIFRLEDARLIVLAPKRPPGGYYLDNAFPFLSIYTFRTVQVGDQLGLLIERCRPDQESEILGAPNTRTAVTPNFRTGASGLSPEEELYFQRL
jgi:hypothetical protein